MTRSPLLHMAGGFLLMGGWAAFANRAHPLPDIAAAALTQGMLTAVITLGLKRGIEAISARTHGWAAMVLPPLAAFGVSLVLLSAIHALARTPELAATIVVPLAVSTTYAALYAHSLLHG